MTAHDLHLAKTESRRSVAEMAKARRKFDFYFAAVVIFLSIAIVAVGLLNRIDINAMLDDWREGVLVLAGAFFLFAYTIQLNLSLRHESRLSELERLYLENTRLAERARRKLQDRNISAAE
jgi:hypothetical protein